MLHIHFLKRVGEKKSGCGIQEANQNNLESSTITTYVLPNRILTSVVTRLIYSWWNWLIEPRGKCTNLFAAFGCQTQHIYCFQNFARNAGRGDEEQDSAALLPNALVQSKRNSISDKKNNDIRKTEWQQENAWEFRKEAIWQSLIIIR